MIPVSLPEGAQENLAFPDLKLCEGEPHLNHVALTGEKLQVLMTRTKADCQGGVACEVTAFGEIWSIKRLVDVIQNMKIQVFCTVSSDEVLC